MATTFPGGNWPTVPVVVKKYTAVFFATAPLLRGSSSSVGKSIQKVLGLIPIFFLQVSQCLFHQDKLMYIELSLDSSKPNTD